MTFFTCLSLKFSNNLDNVPTEVAYDFQLTQGFNLIPDNQTSIFQHLKNLRIFQWLLSIIHKRIKSKSSALVRIVKRRGGICYCKSNIFISTQQFFQIKNTKRNLFESYKSL